MVNISIDEASKKSFLEVIQIVNENGAAVILKDGRQYILHEYKEPDKNADSIKFRESAERIMNKHMEAFRELAK